MRRMSDRRGAPALVTVLVAALAACGSSDGAEADNPADAGSGGTGGSAVPEGGTGGSGGGAVPEGGTGGSGGGAGGQVAPAALVSISLEGDTTGLAVGDERPLVLLAHHDDDSQTDVTAMAEWTTSDSAIFTAAEGKVMGVAPGTATLTAKFEGQEASAELTVAWGEIDGLAISPQLAELKRGETEQLTVTVTYANGITRDVTPEVTWTSSNPDVATVDEAGVVTTLRGGDVQLTATFGEETVTLDTTGTCEYPRFGAVLRYGAILPPVYWDDAYRADGTKFDFKVEDVYCDVSYKDVDVIFFIISAGWCTPCTLYSQRLIPEARFIEEAGGLVVIVEGQDTDFGPADNDFAQRHIEHNIGDAYGIRVGDHDTKPIADFMHNQPMVAAFPTTIAVRTRDMAVITDSNHSQYYLPLQQIAEDPEADWSNPGLPPFSNHCGDGDEEATDDDNDNPATATPLPPGTVHGGICNENPDFYQIDAEGDWTAELDFDATIGDLDFFVWDLASNQPLSDGNDYVGSAGTGNHEEFSWQGPAVIGVIGWQGASTGYDLKLTAR